MTRHAPDASVVIVSFNTRDILRTCLSSLPRAPGWRGRYAECRGW